MNLSKGDKVGLVGRNGTGKSTLIKILTGDETAESGEVKTPKNYKIGKLDQHISFSEKTVMKECIKVLPPEDQYDEYKVEKILMGLGMSVSDMDRDPNTFSGGYQIRIQLAKVLLGRPDLLLLDELKHSVLLDDVALLFRERPLRHRALELFQFLRLRFKHVGRKLVALHNTEARVSSLARHRARKCGQTRRSKHQLQ